MKKRKPKRATVKPTTQFSIDFNHNAAIELARKIGDQRRWPAKADEVCPGFGERAINFIAAYAKEHWERGANFSGEVCVNAAKANSIIPHDDRAFGGVFKRAISMGLIEIAGTVPRAKGHGAPGGRMYRPGAAVRGVNPHGSSSGEGSSVAEMLETQQ